MCVCVGGGCSVKRLGVSDGHGVQHLVQQLQGPVQVDLDPARGLLDALPWVVGAPALYKAHPEDAEAPQVVHPDPCCRRQTWTGRQEHCVRAAPLHHHSLTHRPRPRHSVSQSVLCVLMAGAIPPTDPGPGMFPATAAAWAAAAACAVAACCCICLWHWRRSKTCKGEEHTHTHTHTHRFRWAGILMARLACDGSWS